MERLRARPGPGEDGQGEEDEEEEQEEDDEEEEVGRELERRLVSSEQRANRSGEKGIGRGRFLKAGSLGLLGPRGGGDKRDEDTEEGRSSKGCFGRTAETFSSS